MQSVLVEVCDAFQRFGDVLRGAGGLLCCDHLAREKTVARLLARALLDGRTFATPDDVKHMALDVLRHRVLINYEAEADGVRAEHVVEAVLGSVETP